MQTLSFIVEETPDTKLATVGTQLTLEQAAQLLELNAHTLFGHAYLAESVTIGGLTLRVVHDREAEDDE